MKAKIAAVIAFALVAAGCQTAADIDTAIQKSLPGICRSAMTVHSAFIAVSVSGAVSDANIRREAQAWGILEALCIDPSKATSASVLLTALDAYTVIAKALREAKVAK